MDIERNLAATGNILIIDDKPEDIKILSQTLSEQGYTVRGVVKGTMGIKAAQLSAPDLILLDIKMSGLDGYEVCKILKSHPQTKDIPVIFLSALNDVVDKVKALQMGGVDYITKPFQLEEVIARVKNQLLIRQLTKQLQEQNQQLQQEIIERRQAEAEAAAASQAKSEFVANMSHELRTPLNAILGFTQILRRDNCLNLEQREYIEIIHNSGDHLLGLINDVLELSKIEAGILILNETVFDCYRFFDSLEEMFFLKAEQKGIYLNFQIFSEVPQYIETDEQKLRGCLINLIGNAIKFTKTGGVSLRVSVAKNSRHQPVDGEKITINFEVEDTGLGIAPEEIPNLFQAFSQTETGRQSAEGTGLGLAITHKFLQLMNGEITVDSTVGVGTIFQVKIPANVAEPEQLSSKLQQRVVGLELKEIKYRILVVDDTKENRLLLVKLLQPIGFEVREAVNGQEAVIEWENFQPHLIFMDTRMPVMDGLTAAREIRSRETFVTYKEQFKTVIIALTASAFVEQRPKIVAAGCDDFVRKPFADEIIFATIQQYLGLRYIYEDIPQFTSSTKRMKTISAQVDSLYQEKMQAMPERWVVALQEAAQNLDEMWIFELITEIPDNHALLAEALKNLVNDFRLDVILRLTELVIKSEE
jgi:signal transduction histidine kinase